MEEVENVNEEIQQEEVVQPPEETPIEENDNHQDSSQSDKEYNFAQLRKSKEQLQRKVEELEENLSRLTQTPVKEEDEDDFGIEDEDLAEGRHVKKMYKELRQLQKQLKEEKLASIPDRLKARFNDFGDVVSAKTLKQLQKTEPELYQSINSGADPYAAGVSAYRAIKALNLHESFDEQKAVVKGNHSKPMSTQAIKGQGALSDSNIFAKGLTPELKKQLNQEMIDAAKAR